MKVEYQGITASIAAHARRLGYPQDVCVDRARKYGVSSDALAWNFSPDTHIRKVEYQGVLATIRGHAKRLGICDSVCQRRAKQLGVSPETLPKIFAPIFVWPKIVYRGIADTVAGHARRLGLKPKTCNIRAEHLGLCPENYDRIFAPPQRRIEYHGIVDSVKGHARRVGINPQTAYERMKLYGKSPDALERVFKPSKPAEYEYNGVKDTLKGHAKRLGIGWQTVLKRRIKHGESAETLPLLLAPLQRHWHAIVYEGVRDSIKGHARRLGLRESTATQRARRYGVGEAALPLVFSKTTIVPQCKTYTHDGITDTLSGWARRLGLTVGGLRKRMMYHAPEVALSYPRLEQYCAPENFKRAKCILTYNGETHTAGGWARITGLSRSALRSRIERGLPPEKVLARCAFHSPRQTRRSQPVRSSLAALGIVA